MEKGQSTDADTGTHIGGSKGVSISIYSRRVADSFARNLHLFIATPPAPFDHTFRIEFGRTS